VVGWFVTCFVDATGLCSDCEEAWEAEKNLDFLSDRVLRKTYEQNPRILVKSMYLR
jgi:hypothetical protein